MPWVFRFVICMALLCASAAAQTRWLGDTTHAPTVGVFLAFDHAASASLIKAIEHEAGTVFGDFGLKFSWLIGDTQVETFDNLAVLRFRGSCRMQEMAGPVQESAGPVTWCATEVYSDAVGLFSDVLCDQIRSSISSLLETASSLDQDAAFGRALGRVVAHELYHILADTPRHTRTGVTKALLTPFDLIRTTVHIDQQAMLFLRKRLNLEKSGGPNSGLPNSNRRPVKAARTVF